MTKSRLYSPARSGHLFSSDSGLSGVLLEFPRTKQWAMGSGHDDNVNAGEQPRRGHSSVLDAGRLSKSKRPHFPYPVLCTYFCMCCNLYEVSTPYSVLRKAWKPKSRLSCEDATTSGHCLNTRECVDNDECSPVPVGPFFALLKRVLPGRRQKTLKSPPFLGFLNTDVSASWRTLATSCPPLRYSRHEWTRGV